MAKVLCPLCEQPVSEKAAMCPHCGEPLKEPPASPKTDWMDLFWKAITILIIPGLGFLWSEIKSARVDAKAEIQQKTDQVAAKAESERKKLAEDFEKTRKQVDRVQQLFDHFASREPGQHRLAMLMAIAYMRIGEIPKEVIPMLAVYDVSADPDVREQLRKALEEISANEAKTDIRNLVDQARAILAARDALSPTTTLTTNERQFQDSITDQAQTALATTQAKVPSPGPNTTALTAPASQSQAAQETIINLAPALVAQAGKESGPSKAAEILWKAALPKDILEKAIATLPGDVKNKLRPRIYLQITGENQRPSMRALQEKLSAAGYVCPGVQNVSKSGKFPDALEVRYFSEDPLVKSEAEKILALVKESGAKDGGIEYDAPTGNDLRISPDIKTHFEVWAGKNSF